MAVAIVLTKRKPDYSKTVPNFDHPLSHVTAIQNTDTKLSRFQIPTVCLLSHLLNLRQVLVDRHFLLLGQRADREVPRDRVLRRERIDRISLEYDPVIRQEQCPLCR